MILVRHIIEHRPLPFLLSTQQSVVEASRFLRKHHIGGAPVVKDGDLVGFCSERDLVYRVVAEKRDPAETTVEEIMSRDVVSAHSEDRVEECERTMKLHHVRHLPIVEGNKVVACISLRDLLQSELDESEIQVQCLTEYIRGDVQIALNPAGR